MKPLVIAIAAGALMCSACNNIRQRAADAASTTTTEVGKAVGKTSTEFVSGVKDGIDNASGCTLEMSANLRAAGLETGKMMVTEDSGSTNKNKLSVYIIFSKDYNKPVVAKVFDASGREYGRVMVQVNSKSGSARFYDFVFDKRTDIEGRSRVTLD